MNKNQLYKEYARVIEMCEGTELENTPWVCVKVGGIAFSQHESHPGFNALKNKYEFAVAVLGGKPVFVGDKLLAEARDK